MVGQSKLISSIVGWYCLRFVEVDEIGQRGGRPVSNFTAFRAFALLFLLFGGGGLSCLVG
jgi:hypothetical protein